MSTGSIETYEVDRAHRTFGHSDEEMVTIRESAVELLRCCADGGDADDEHGATIEQVALELDCSLFVTLLARLWYQNVMAMLGEPFEAVKAVQLEAALRLEGSGHLISGSSTAMDVAVAIAYAGPGASPEHPFYGDGP